MFSPALLVAFTFSAVLYSVVAQLPTDCDRSFIVGEHQDCDEISAAQNVSTFQLAKVNAGLIAADCSNLFPGEPLCLGITGQDCQNVTVVQSGDFCALIADNAGIDVTTLLANNPNVNSDCTNIYVGEVLCTAGDVIPYSS